MRVMTRRDMTLAPIVNGWQLQYANRSEPFQDPASPVLFIWSSGLPCFLVE